MPAKRKASPNKQAKKAPVTEKASEVLRAPAKDSDKIIKVRDLENEKHYLNWTRLCTIAPRTCLIRVFERKSEDVGDTPMYPIPGWFMSALCAYVASEYKDAVFSVPEEHHYAARKIFHCLCYAPGPDEIVVHPAMVPLDDGSHELNQLMESAARLSLKLLKNSNLMPSRVSIEGIDTVHMTLSTKDDTSPVWTNLVRNLYSVIKLLGPAADDDCCFSYKFESHVRGVSGNLVAVEGRIYNVRSSKYWEPFWVSYDLLFAQRDSPRISGAF